MNSIGVKFGEIIREARLEKGMTMKELGAKIGVSETCMHYYEKGTRDIHLDTFFQLCQILNLSPNEIQKALRASL